MLPRGAGLCLRTRKSSVAMVPMGAYPTADGTDVLIAANADSVFGRLCDAMGRAELASDIRYATHAARGANDLFGLGANGWSRKSRLGGSPSEARMRHARRIAGGIR